MKSHLVILMSICLYAHVGAKESHSSQIHPDGKTTISAAVGNTKLVAMFETATVRIDRNDAAPRIPQCTYSRFPCLITRKLSLRVNNVEVFLPRSVYSELADVQSAELSGKGGMFFLTIKGGDASEAFIVRLQFKTRLLERQIFSGGDPYHPLEITRYYDVSTSD